MREYTVRDKFEDVIVFTGDKLSHATTRKTDNDRWTEINIYKTRAGKYVIEVLGKSVRYHRRGSTCASGMEISGSQIGSESQPCPVCDPDVPEDVTFNILEKFTHEVTRSSATVVETPQEVREALIQRNSDPSKTRPSWVASEALRVAGSVDPVLREDTQQVIHID